MSEIEEFELDLVGFCVEESCKCCLASFEIRVLGAGCSTATTKGSRIVRAGSSRSMTDIEGFELDSVGFFREQSSKCCVASFESRVARSRALR